MNGDTAWLLSKFILVTAADIVLLLSTVVYTTLIFGLTLVTTKNPGIALLSAPAPFMSGLLVSRWFRAMIVPKVLHEVYGKKEEGKKPDGQ